MTDPQGLRKAYEADSWPRPTAAEQVLAWRFRLNGNELEGWRPHRIQQTRLDNTTAALFSVWVPAKEPTGALLIVNVFETPSAADARECLLRLLGDVQGPRLPRIDGVGDVAFGAGRLSALFARNNVVVQAGSVERVEVPVAEFAQRLDRWISSVPETAPTGPATRFRLSRDAGGKAVRITLPQDESTSGPWYKFVIRGGTARAEPDAMVVAIEGASLPEVTAFTVDQAGSTSRSVLQLP